MGKCLEQFTGNYGKLSKNERTTVSAKDHLGCNIETLTNENIKGFDNSSVIKANSSWIKTHRFSRIHFGSTSTSVGMVLNDTEITTIPATEISSMFFSCPYAPNLLRDLNGTTFSWILLNYMK